ncbi:hypothetical protein ABG79_00291 [Caloramator mitchellensis]|uniref:Uncharacterized protein n=1 Tax=Caloramator mitchellensis TaxID=908809 RepID=A0A0R3JYH9_CALMK|nr:hypothetical protein [Caloramator mitchellensis]KRQ88122.1 hypothetical protein ABG79_00291 [Caloramator mitchellensis]
MFWYQLGIITAIVIVSVIIFNYLRPFLLKTNIKKSHLIILLIVLLILPPFLGNLYKAPVVQYTQMLLVSLTTLAFVDFLNIEKTNKNKKIIGRPKPKPNRIKDKKNNIDK